MARSDPGRGTISPTDTALITAQRLLFALASVVLAAIAASLFFIVVTVNGVTYLHIVQISLLVLLKINKR